jgi:hypothetical protein
LAKNAMLNRQSVIKNRQQGKQRSIKDIPDDKDWFTEIKLRLRVTMASSTNL